MAWERAGALSLVMNVAAVPLTALRPTVALGLAPAGKRPLRMLPVIVVVTPPAGTSGIMSVLLMVACVGTVGSQALKSTVMVRLVRGQHCGPIVRSQESSAI